METVNKRHFLGTTFKMLCLTLRHQTEYLEVIYTVVGTGSQCGGGRVHLVVSPSVLRDSLSLSLCLPPSLSLSSGQDRSTTHQLHLPKWISRYISHLAKHCKVTRVLSEHFSTKSDSNSDASPRSGKILSLVHQMLSLL